MNEIGNNEKENQRSHHDEFFRNVFSDVKIARDFIENYLPSPILKMVELENLEIQPGTFVDEKLKRFSTDMLFKTTINKRDGYVYFLFEHKSYPERLVALQLLNYMVRIWNQKVDKENATHIPVVIPMVIYHGKTKWNIGTLKDLIFDFDLFPEEARKMIPDFDYLIYDISGYSDEEIKGQAKLRILISVLKAVFGNSGEYAEQTLVKAGDALAELEESEKGIEYFEICLRYIVDSRLDFNTEQLNVVIKELSDSFKEGSEVAMTLAEKLREEGFEKGLEKGREKGLEEGKKELAIGIAVKRLTKKFGIMPAEFRGKIDGLDLTSLEILNYEIDDFNSLDDVRKYLAL